MNRGGVAAVRQGFWAPPELPHVEIRTTLDSSSPYATHFHDAFSIGMILDGCTRLTWNGGDSIVRTGELVLLEPGLAHSCNPVEGCARSYHMLYVSEGWIRKRLGEAGGTLAIKQRRIVDPALFKGLREAVASLCTGGSGAQLDEVLGGLLSEYVCLEQVDNRGELAGELTDKMSQARAALGDRVDLRLDGLELARKTGLGREGFIRAFHRTTGLPPGMYRQCLRLGEGRRLLRLGASIAEAALATGYADQSHFHRMFVKYYSVTPRRYQLNKSLSFKK